MSDIARLEIEVDAEPTAGLLRAGIDAAISGRLFPAGPEAEIGQAVGKAVAQHHQRAQHGQPGTGG
ncbi:hypothetical protein ACPPVO_36360 [Dactylosporangium sp. McL0621]|uniref:hypothetical protein n=1 Tax=Dactylosporangium sp. McL0621 TaxID=3415678 RepID=UPI003CF911C8